MIISSSNSHSLLSGILEWQTCRNCRETGTWIPCETATWFQHSQFGITYIWILLALFSPGLKLCFWVRSLKKMYEYNIIHTLCYQGKLHLKLVHFIIQCMTHGLQIIIQTPFNFNIKVDIGTTSITLWYDHQSTRALFCQCSCQADSWIITVSHSSHLPATFLQHRALYCLKAFTLLSHIILVLYIQHEDSVGNCKFTVYFVFVCVIWISKL